MKLSCSILPWARRSFGTGLALALVMLPLSGWAKDDQAGGPNEDVTVGSVTFTPEQQKSRFYADFRRWAKADAKQEKWGEDSLLAIGSSSMRGWKTIQEDLAPSKVVHRGFGGSTMGDVLKMLSFFQQYPSDTVLIYEGDNDLARKVSAEKFMSQAKAVVDGLRETNPDVKIYFISIKPSIKRAQLMEKMVEVNRQLEAYCAADEGLDFIDVYQPMLDEEGKPNAELFTGDKLHMKPAGYEIWTTEVRKKLGLPAASR